MSTNGTLGTIYAYIYPLSDLEAGNLTNGYKQPFYFT